MESRSQVPRTDWIRFSLITVALVLVNVASTRLFLRVDLTANRAYSLSSSSTDVLAGLQEPLTIKAFFTRSLPYPYNNVEQQVRDLLEEYGLRANRFFNYEVYSLEPEGEGSSEKAEEFRQMAQDYGIYPIQIQKVERDEVKLQSAYLGMVLLHGDMVQTIPALTATDNLEYTVTSAVQKLANKTSALLALDGSVGVTLYQSAALDNLGSNLGRTFRAIPGEIEAMVDELNRKLYGKLAFRRLDPDSDEAAGRGAEDLALMRLSLSTGQTAYASVVVSHGTNHRTLSLITQGLFGAQVRDPQTLDTPLEEAVEAVIGVNPQIGFVASASEGEQDELSALLGPQQEPSFANLRFMVGDNYTVEDVDLGGEDIPEGVRTLVVAGLRRKLSDWELYRVDQFLMRGSSLALFVDTHREIVPQGGNAYTQQPVYLPLETGLENLLQHYGVEIQKSYVLDENCYVSRQRSSSGGVQEIPFYFFPKIEKEGMNQKLAFMRNIPLLFMLDASPLRMVEGEQSGATVREVLSSSPTSWEMSEEINLYNPLFISPPSSSDATRGSKTMAYLLEGSFTSYFQDKPLPEPPSPPEGTGDETAQGTASDTERLIPSRELERVAALIPQTTRGKIFVVGTSEILTDNVIDQQGSEPNAQFVMNVLDYLSGREGFAVMRTKGTLYSPLREVKPEVRTFVKMFNTAGLPVLVALAGIGVWFIWMARRRRIRDAFAPRGPGGSEGAQGGAGGER